MRQVYRKRCRFFSRAFTSTKSPPELASISCLDPHEIELSVADARQALLKYKLVVFNDVEGWTQAAMVDFFSHFAEPLQQAGRAEEAGSKRPEIFEVTNKGSDSPFLSNAEIPWHSDLSYRSAPGSLGALYSHQIPDSGSHTFWADCTAAADLIDPSLRRDLLDVRAVHYHPEPHMNDVEAAEVTHPVVRVHRETGEHSLFISPYFTKCIVGMSDVESSKLLSVLFTAITHPSVLYKHVWARRQLVLYDNRCTNHMRPGFNGERVLWRTQAREAGGGWHITGEGGRRAGDVPEHLVR
jgi:taurine dioxygenase